MNTDALFRELEPPPGGAERFAARLDAIVAEGPPRRPRALALAAAAAVATAAVVATVLLQGPDTAPEPSIAAAPPAVEVYGAPEFDRLLGRASRPAELTVIVNTETARVTELATTHANVRIYQIN
jgi:hypothetical protein